MADTPTEPHPVPAPAGPEHDRALSVELEAAVERFRRMILGVGLRHGLGEAEVDEVMQEVRLRLWRNRGEVETLRGVGASYVYRTAASAALDLIRARRARRTGRDVVAPLEASLVSPMADPGVELEQREFDAQVLAAVERLSESRRPVVRMHLAGYEREEIARTLGWTAGKVRNLLSRGLADLRAMLEDSRRAAGEDR